MTIPYKKLFVIWPPRPEGSVHPRDLSKFPGWLAQFKFNGTRTTIYLDPEGNVHLRSRHREEHKLYLIHDHPKTHGGLKSLLDSPLLERGKWQVFDGEILHSKTVSLKDRIVLWDILVHNGSYLTGTTYQERLSRLTEALGNPTEYEEDTGRKVALVAAENVWMSETFTPANADEAGEIFNRLVDMDEIEGVVLKDPGGILKPGVGEKNNSEWLVRVRKPHKDYRY